jgi:hypothetical protein
MTGTKTGEGGMNVSFNADIPLDDSHDVVVAGGGPAGCAAALAAARHGAKVLLLEYASGLGGMGTAGLVPAWCPFSDGEKIIYRGIAQEVFERVKAGMPRVEKDDLDWVPIDAELLKRTLDRLLADAGVDVIFNTMVIGADVEAGPSGKKRIRYLSTAHKGGLRAWGGNVFIDCTGDADMVALAGIERRHGDEKTGEVQPATHCFILSNVDEFHYQTMPLLHAGSPESASYDIARSDKYPEIKDAHCCHSLIGPRTVGFNAGHLWDVDPCDPYGISKALMLGREIAHQYHEALKELLPEVFGAAWLSQTASAMGLRETWRVIGDYELSLADYFARRTFPDEIGRNSYFLDVHLSKKDRERLLLGEINGEEEFNRYNPGESHGLPRRILQVRDGENILAAGKNVSAEHRVHGSIRVMPVCFVMGQAAGVMAALTGKGKDVRSVDTALLRETLKKDGAYFL